MVLIDADLKLVRSEHTVGGIKSLGGAMTGDLIIETPGSLWDNISSSELSSTVVGEYEVRCIYVKNDSPTNDKMEGVAIWLDFNTASPYTDVDIGVGTAAVGDVEQTVANENTLPDNIFWTFARGEENALPLGLIEKGQGKSVWIRRHAGPARADASTPSDNYILAFRVLKTAGGGGPGPTGNDPFGVRMVYATNPAPDVSTPAYMNMTNPTADCRFMTDTTVGKNADGSYFTGGSTRLRLYSSNAPGCAKDTVYNTILDTYDHDVWGERGYMFAPGDWRDVEITGYFKVATVDPANTGDRKIYLYSRTLRHNTKWGGGCSGCAYKGVIYADGDLKFHKESFHDGSQPCGDRAIFAVPDVQVPATDNDKWFGMKVMMWNFVPASNPNATHVHMEIWLDLQATNTWNKYAEHDDTGGWYPGAPDANCPGDTHCGGNQDQIIKFGGPTTEFRWDAGYTKVDFKWLSCREILKATPVTPSPPPPPGGPPGSPPCDLPLPGL